MRTMFVILEIKVAELIEGKEDVANDCKRVIETELGYVCEVNIVAAQANENLTIERMNEIKIVVPTIK